MTNKRKIEIYSAGCSICNNVIDQVREAACKSCDIIIRDIMQPEVQRSASNLGILSLPAVVVDGELSGCCSGRSIDLEVLRQAGLGQPME